MDAYSLFKTYVALKTHFTVEEYDFLKYDGKVRTTEVSFKKRKDFMMFYKASEWIPQKIVIPFLVSHFITLNNFTIHFILENPVKSQKIFTSWKLRTEDILTSYQNDLKTIAQESNYSWKDCIRQEEDDYPLLFKLVSSYKITPETYSLLDDLFNQTSKTYKGLDTDTLFQSMNLKYRKYRVFLSPTLEDILKVTPKDLTKLKNSV